MNSLYLVLRLFVLIVLAEILHSKLHAEKVNTYKFMCLVEEEYNNNIVVRFIDSFVALKRLNSILGLPYSSEDEKNDIDRCIEPGEEITDCGRAVNATTR